MNDSEALMQGFLHDSNQGANAYAIGDYENARHCFEIALKKISSLMTVNPEIYGGYLAQTLYNLGLILHDQNRLDEAIEMYGRALEVRERLAAGDPERYEGELADTLYNLGNCFYGENRHDEAIAAYGRALEIYERLAEANPERFEGDLARTLTNLGNSLDDQNRSDQALVMYGRALEIRERLAEANPERYEGDLALTLTNLGVTLRVQNRSGEAIAAYGRALEIHERLAAANPERYEGDLAWTLNNLSSALGARAAELREALARVYRTGQGQDAYLLRRELEQRLRQSETVLRRLLKARPGNYSYRYNLAQVLNSLTSFEGDSEARLREALVLLDGAENCV